jgi:glyoxylase-like metal-dependent hydrolase (beta-lactamase superfamily II)/rhodanese-related sulfurtransferase
MDDATEAIDADALACRVAAGEPVRLLDLRDRDATEAWRIDGPAVTFSQLPSSRVLQAEVTDSVADLAAEIDGDGPITVVCAEGESSDYAAELLREAGIPAQNLADGMEGWARVYRSTEIAADPTVVQYHRPSSGCLAYAVVSDGEAAVVDPLCAFTDRYAADLEARGADVVAVLDTHVHADHVSGLRSLSNAVGVPRYLPAGSVDRGVTYDVEPLADGDRIPVGEAALEAVALPGHTAGMTGFAVGDVLLTGDSLFLDGVARPDLAVDGADARADLARELHGTVTERLASVDDETIVAPGHVGGAAAGETTHTATLGDLRDRLAGFDLDADAFVDRVGSDLPPPPANADRIVAINSGSEDAEAETAFELELGPNNCAAGTFDG